MNKTIEKYTELFFSYAQVRIPNKDLKRDIKNSLIELSYEHETRVYIISVDDKGSDDYTNEEFITLAEEQGTVMTLRGFQDEFNYTENISQSLYIRIITQ